MVIVKKALIKNIYCYIGTLYSNLSERNSSTGIMIDNIKLQILLFYRRLMQTFDTMCHDKEEFYILQLLQSKPQILFGNFMT